MVHAQVVRDAHCPGQELAFVRITAIADRIDDADENVLEDVLGEVLIFYEKVDRSIQLVLVAQYQRFQRIYVAGNEQS
jgi:HD superfamily phosphohydrolase